MSEKSEGFEDAITQQKKEKATDIEALHTISLEDETKYDDIRRKLLSKGWTLAFLNAESCDGTHMEEPTSDMEYIGWSGYTNVYLQPIVSKSAN